MGQLQVEKLRNNPNKTKYVKQLLADITALQHILDKKMFEQSPIRIGAEQEFCLVDELWQPSNKAMEILASINDPHFTSELALYNLEINLDPIPLSGNCFSNMHSQLDDLLAIAKDASEKYATKIILCGILPTITKRHLDIEYMTPLSRYKILNEIVKETRNIDLEFHIKGVDELNIRHDSVLYEGCNTSFQTHLQIDPYDFEDAYNWSQAIAGPILSICTNSPMLFGRELWEETRIALFTQSMDTRASNFLLNESESRVNFGNKWANGTVVDYFKDSISGFRSLLFTNVATDSVKELKQVKTPKLKALSLHNGTVYTWNRICYGITNGKPHIRIENRYLPSGPTTEDEIANMMLWVGIMMGRPKEYNAIHTKMDFKDAKSNFFNAARYGMATQFYWDGKLIPSQKLLLDYLLPMAFKGLYSMGVLAKDVEHYLKIIEKRIASSNGSRWTILSYRKLRKDFKIPDALTLLTAKMHEGQQKGYSIDAWQLPRGDASLIDKDNRKVYHSMSVRTITAQDSDSVELVFKMMQWKNIHHVPILNDELDLVGLLTWTDLKAYLKNPDKFEGQLLDYMKTELITITEFDSIDLARELMRVEGINCLPVVHGKKLVGIITSKDL
ncbi:CBS domain-containing protein [Arenibacter latericius]|uniref:CBS domain-containing protein n=1 Tax=Arenibacter latericius TaxID=86104 RepID=UPI0003FB7490|nr:CBS domain-containing protein [Arenibacter latericius]